MKSQYCPVCKEVKPPSCYYRDKTKRSGLSSYCKECVSDTAKKRYEQTKAERKAERQRKRAPIRKQRQALYKVNRERILARGARFRTSHPDYWRVRDYRVKYGMTLADYGALAKEQGNRCAICRQVPRERHLVVDHDHDNRTQILVRGLLCDRCNRVLGAVREDRRVLEGMIHYLNTAKRRDFFTKKQSA